MIKPTPGRPSPFGDPKSSFRLRPSKAFTPTRRLSVPVEALEPVGKISLRKALPGERPRPRLIVFPSVVSLDEGVFPAIPDGALLVEAREHLLLQLDEGGSCPCCGQFAKRYWRGLNATMARGLLWLLKVSGKELRWVHINSEGPSWLTSKGGTMALLAHWGLIEEQPKEERKESRTSAMWRPTVRGARFAKNRILVPSHVLLYNNRLEGCSEETVNIVEALGKKFDYAEIMAGMDDYDVLHQPHPSDGVELSVVSDQSSVSGPPMDDEEVSGD